MCRLKCVYELISVVIPIVWLRSVRNIGKLTVTWFRNLVISTLMAANFHHVVFVQIRRILHLLYGSFRKEDGSVIFLENSLPFTTLSARSEQNISFSYVSVVETTSRLAVVKNTSRKSSRCKINGPDVIDVSSDQENHQYRNSERWVTPPLISVTAPRWRSGRNTIKVCFYTHKLWEIDLRNIGAWMLCWELHKDE